VKTSTHGKGAGSGLLAVLRLATASVPHQVGQGVGGGDLVLGLQVQVVLHRQVDIRVAEESLQGLGVNASLRGERGVGVP